MGMPMYTAIWEVPYLNRSLSSKQVKKQKVKYVNLQLNLPYLSINMGLYFIY